MIHAFNGGYFHRGDDPGSTEVDTGITRQARRPMIPLSLN